MTWREYSYYLARAVQYGLPGTLFLALLAFGR